jgi:hypothetical protein
VDGELGHVLAAGAWRHDVDPTSTGSDRAESAKAAAVVSRTFRYLRSFAWRRVFGWLWRKHREASKGDLLRRYCEGGWWPHVDGVWLFNPTRIETTRYRYRGAAIPTPWASVAM